MFAGDGLPKFRYKVHSALDSRNQKVCVLYSLEEVHTTVANVIVELRLPLVKTTPQNSCLENAWYSYLHRALPLHPIHV